MSRGLTKRNLCWLWPGLLVWYKPPKKREGLVTLGIPSLVPRLFFAHRGENSLVNCQSRAQTPPSHEERGVVTIEQFLGCAESAK